MINLQQKLEHKFVNQNLLKVALTHSSVDSHVAKNYERLEFLGDRVLGVAVASLLFKMFPHEPEGNLSQRFTALVCAETVAEVARLLDMNKAMIVQGEEIRDNENVLCDVCEAVIGAIYIDGGIEAAINFVNSHWKNLIDKKIAPPRDAKSMLQEIAHVKGLGMPHYEVINREGPEHEPTFTIRLAMEGIEAVEAKGHSKKTAEFAAAEQMLKKIDNI